MANIDFKLKLSDFKILKKNEKGPDEPYLWAFYIQLDGNSINFQNPDQSFVAVTSPRAGSDDLGAAAAKGLGLGSGAIPVPAAIGEFVGTLSSDKFKDFNPPLPSIEPFCSVAALVIALESDSSSDADMEVARIKVRNELQLQLNANLRLIVTDIKTAIIKGGPLLTPKEIQDKLSEVNIKRFRDLVVASVTGAVVNDAVGGVVGLLTGLFPPFGLAQVIDPDDFIGHAILGPIQLSDLVSAGGAGVPITLDLGSMASSSEGDYRVTGNIHRTDSAEFATLALNRPAPTSAPAQLDVYIRNSSRKMSRSTQSPPTLKGWTTPWSSLPEGTFLSGPAVASSNDGKKLHVFGLGMDNRIWRAFSADGGLSWPVSWAPIGEGKFVSAPAVAVSADGSQVHVFGRGLDNKIWRAHSADGGSTWALNWAPIGTGTFNSAPAAAISDDGNHLHVFGRGMDNRVWRAHSSSGGDHWNLAWVPIGEGTFISGPAAVISGNGQALHVFGRGMDHHIWRAFSSNGGASFSLAWAPIPGGAFSSGPAAAMSVDGQEVHVAALGNDLEAWHSFSTNAGAGWESGWSQISGAIGF